MGDASLPLVFSVVKTAPSQDWTSDDTVSLLSSVIYTHSFFQGCMRHQVWIYLSLQMSVVELLKLGRIMLQCPWNQDCCLSHPMIRDIFQQNLLDLKQNSIGEIEKLLSHCHFQNISFQQTSLNTWYQENQAVRVTGT